MAVRERAEKLSGAGKNISSGGDKKHLIIHGLGIKEHSDEDFSVVIRNDWNQNTAFLEEKLKKNNTLKPMQISFADDE